MAGDTVLAVSNRPECSHPLIESDRGIFHHCADLDGELFLAGVAVPDTARLNERVLGLIAARAYYVTVEPPHSQSSVADRQSKRWPLEASSALS